MKRSEILLLLISLFVDVGYLKALTRRYDAVMLPELIYDSRSGKESGIIGSVLSGGKLEVKVFEKETNTLLYHVYTNASTTDFGGNATQYRKSELGAGAIYYPETWDSKSINISFASVDRRRYDKIRDYPYRYIQNPLNVYFTITEENGTMQLCKIPGIGVIDETGGNAMFDHSHFCHDFVNNNHPVTKIWTRVKSPLLSARSDLMVAAHRGYWGNNLGDGYPENSRGSFYDSQQFTDILETDIMITKDKKMVISHDYSLSRLSNYPGPLTDYLFDLDSKVLNGLLLRKRNTAVSEYPYLKFEDLLDILLEKKMVLTVDIKDVRARRVNGVCVANCEYDPKIHGDAALLKIKESWMTCLQTCIKLAQEKNAIAYIAFKTPYTYKEMSEYVPDSVLKTNLFMPVIQPNRKDFLSFTKGWIKDGGKKVIAYETNFLNEKDPYLRTFSDEGDNYVNLLEYVYKKTGLRSACYPEEPIGQMGTVTRWVEWKMKYTKDDRRGDHYFLMTIPYGRIMILTTDRPDIWTGLNNMYKEGGL